MIAYSEQIERLLASPLRDYAGNVLSAKQHGESVKLSLATPDGKIRNIGSLLEHPEHGIIYQKFEDEKNIQRSASAWSIPTILLPMIHWIVYRTKQATYRISSQDARVHGKVLPFMEGADRKLYVPIRYWTIKFTDRAVQRRVSLVGYDWYRALEASFSQPYMTRIASNVKEFPQLLQVLKDTPLPDVKVLLLGESPLPGSNHRSWGTKPDEVPHPASALIMDEVAGSLYRGRILQPDYTLSHWAAQGVLLLNNNWNGDESLASDWERLNTAIIEALIRRRGPLVVLLWGDKVRQQYGGCFDPKSTVVLSAPSPLHDPENFYGNGQFVRINQYLHSVKQPIIHW